MSRFTAEILGFGSDSVSASALAAEKAEGAEFINRGGPQRAAESLSCGSASDSASESEPGTGRCRAGSVQSSDPFGCGGTAAAPVWRHRGPAVYSSVQTAVERGGDLIGEVAGSRDIVARDVTDDLGDFEMASRLSRGADGALESGSQVSIGSVHPLGDIGAYTHRGALELPREIAVMHPDGFPERRALSEQLETVVVDSKCHRILHRRRARRPRADAPSTSPPPGLRVGVHVKGGAQRHERSELALYMRADSPARW